MTEAIDLVLKRRSVLAHMMTEPGPNDEDLTRILTAGARVPDHGKLAPWRFVVLKGEARAEFGRVLGEAFRMANPDASEGKVELEARRFTRAPVVVAVVSRAEPHAKIPEWEQVLSSGAVCMNMLTAANALGYCAQWLTEWPAYDGLVQDGLGLESHERISGFIYIGSPKEPPTERPRPELDDIVTNWQS